jgi:phosphoribosylformimino-5-aminoimidazole carboxamide ribotide isomerase
VAITAAIAQIMNVIGSGGIATVDHLRQLADAGAEAAIVGTALYTGAITLPEALLC